MKLINLTKGYKTIVDDTDYLELSKYKWYANVSYNHISARRNGYINKKKTNIYLHRQIMNFPKNKIIDHINGNSLDNRKSNLRIVSLIENIRNQKIRINNKSGYKGVSWHKYAKKWYAYISGKCIGYFDLKDDAALAYNKMARKIYNNYARLNIIKQ